MSVDFPLWRGPVTETTGNFVANCNSFAFMSRGILDTSSCFKPSHTFASCGFPYDFAIVTTIAL